MPLAIAASLTLVAAAGAWLYVAGHHIAIEPAAQLADAASELQLAEVHYQNAITALEKLTANRDSRLNPEVAEAIAKSLATIDKAIGDSRAALKRATRVSWNR